MIFSPSAFPAAGKRVSIDAGFITIPGQRKNPLRFAPRAPVVFFKTRGGAPGRRRVFAPSPSAPRPAAPDRDPLPAAGGEIPDHTVTF
jgi:hypothetical protein